MISNSTIETQKRSWRMALEIQVLAWDRYKNVAGLYKYRCNSNYEGLSWLWSYGSWTSNYLCNQCLSLIMMWVRILLERGVLDTTLCDKDYQWLAARRWLFPGTLFSSTNKTDHHDITEILLKVMLCTITPPPNYDW
jgi:hypothetical protein